MFNMFIMKYDYFVEYCSWLFNILFKLEEELGNKNRVLGFVGERLLDVWLKKNKILYIENKILYIENQNLLNKYIRFLIRKFVKIK